MLLLVGLFFVLYPTVLCISLVVTRSRKASDEPGDTLLSIFLSVFAFAAHSYCNWFQWHDGESRKTVEDYSYKYVLISLPQLLSVFVIGYYAATFKRRGSEFTHQLMAESCVHQFVITALVLAVLHGGFHMMHSGCCAFPVICPVDVSACLLNDIFECPRRLESTPHYDFVYRAIQVLATFLLLVEMSIVAPIHRFKHLQSRVRRAQFLTFDRNREPPQRPASPSVPMC